MVDVIKAMNDRSGYITPALYGRPNHPWVKPKGGKGGIWRSVGLNTEYWHHDGTWTPLDPGREGSNHDKHQ